MGKLDKLDVLVSVVVGLRVLVNRYLADAALGICFQKNPEYYETMDQVLYDSLVHRLYLRRETLDVRRQDLYFVSRRVVNWTEYIFQAPIIHLGELFEFTYILYCFCRDAILFVYALKCCKWAQWDYECRYGKDIDIDSDISEEEQ